MATVSGSATVLSATRPGEHYDPAEPFWWQSAWEFRFGGTDWDLELEVTVPGQPAYRVAGRWQLPNKVVKLRRTIEGPARLTVGMVLPVTVDSSDHAKVDIDWKAFKASGADAQLHPEIGSVRRELKSFVKDLRTREPPPVPTSPRPTAESHPPIEGVDFDAWMTAIVAIVRGKVSAADCPALYDAHGFPAGRGEAISAQWYERLQSDEVLRDWYVHDTAP